MSLFRTVGRMTTAAVAMTAAAISVSMPAVAQTAAAAPLSTTPWKVSYAGATASGTHTVQQDPLGTGQTRTLRGVIDTGSATGCFHVAVQYGGTNWLSPTTCAGVTPKPFSTTFRTAVVVRPPATVRLCTAGLCGTPATLW